MGLVVGMGRGAGGLTRPRPSVIRAFARSNHAVTCSRKIATVIEMNR